MSLLSTIFILLLSNNQILYVFTDDKWQGVKAASNEQRKLLEDIVTDLRTYKDAGVHLQKWIAQKEKMVAVLGPVATEPSMIKNQLEQVKVCNSFSRHLKQCLFANTKTKNNKANKSHTEKPLYDMLAWFWMYCLEIDPKLLYPNKHV